ncbi:glutamine synthetase [Tanacetum coccineum]
MEEIKSQKNIDDVLEEFHVGPSLGIVFGDELWAARYILEIAGVVVSFYPKPIPVDWNGVGAHTNYSTKFMREEGGYEIIKKAIKKLGLRHKEHIAAYGGGNECRLTGRHETADINTFKWVDWNGVGAYLYIKSLHSIVEY